jgi:hypothetical protein
MVKIMTLGSSAPMEIVYRIVYRFKLVYKFERVVTKLSLHDSMITLVAVLLSLPQLTLALPDCLNVKCNIECW